MDLREKLKSISELPHPRCEAEINLIVKNRFYQYLFDNAVDLSVADAIVRTQDSLAIKRLLQSNQLLSDHSQSRIFNEAHTELKKMLLERKQPLCEKVEKELILQNDNSLVKHYIDHHAFRESAEVLMLKTKPYCVITHYIEQHKLAKSAQLEILKLPKLLRFHVRRHSLSIEAFNEFMADHNNSEALNIIIGSKMSVDAECVLARRADIGIIEKYQNTIGFTNLDEIVSILLKREMTELVAGILCEHKPELTIRVEEQVLTSTPEVVTAYIAYHDLSSDQQVDVINRGNSAEIILLCIANYVQPTAQMRILERGVKNEIKALLEHHQTSRDFQLGLLARGERDEIVTMCSTNTLFVEAQEVLIKRGNNAEITAYFDRRTIENSAFNLLLDSKNDLVRYYIDRNILNDYQLKLFVEKACDADIQRYLELYYPD